MASFGENLRREREMRAVTLEEIAAATKISVRFLQALEAEEFSKLPGGIFSRSFLRAYARYLGLDEERVLAEYQLIAQPKPDVDLSRLTVSRPVPAREASRSPWIALVMAIAMLAGGYALFRYSRNRLEAPRNIAGPPPAPTLPGAAGQPQAGPTSGGGAPAAPSTSEGVAPGSQVPPGVGGVATTPAGASGSIAAGPASADEGLFLQVAATERAWVAIDADGKTTLQRVLNPSEIQTLRAKTSFDVTTGNAQGIILTLNGETLKPLGRRGEVKSIHLTRNYLKNPSP